MEPPFISTRRHGNRDSEGRGEIGIWKFGDRVRGIIWGFDEEGSHGSHSPGFCGVARFRGFLWVSWWRFGWVLCVRGGVAVLVVICVVVFG